jgi:Cu/Ag efflux protein CusF
MLRNVKSLVLVAGLLAVPALASAQDDSGQYQGGGMQGGTQGGMRGGMKGEQSNAGAFKNKSNFKVNGTVSSVDTTNHQITVQRSGMPPAELRIANDTDIKVNGKQASLSQLKPGDEVRAEFNLAENQPIAVSVDAKAKGAGGKAGGSQGSQGGGY